MKNINNIDSIKEHKIKNTKIIYLTSPEQSEHFSSSEPSPQLSSALQKYS